jgi:hypothetical protein
VRRKSFITASTLSLVLCAATAVLWVRSYRRPLSIWFWTTHGLWEVAVRDGRIWLDNEPQRMLDKASVTAIDGAMRSMKSHVAASVMQMGSDQNDPEVLDAAYKNAKAILQGMQEDIRLRQRWSAGVTPYAGISVRCAYPFGFTAILPLACIVAGTRRAARGQCPTCRYNLTGNASGVCPECGTAIETNDAPIKIA